MGPSESETGRYPRRRINRFQERRAGLHGCQTKIDQSGVHHTGLNPSHPEGERDQVLLPPLERGRQYDPRKCNKMDPNTTQIPGSPARTGHKRRPNSERPSNRTVGRNEDIKTREIIRACDKLLLTWKTHGSPLGDRKVKATMYRTISKTADETEKWRDNLSTDDTLTSLTLRERSMDEIRVMDTAILGEEEEAAT